MIAKRIFLATLNITRSIPNPKTKIIRIQKIIYTNSLINLEQRWVFFFSFTFTKKSNYSGERELPLPRGERSYFSASYPWPRKTSAITSGEDTEQKYFKLQSQNEGLNGNKKIRGWYLVTRSQGSPDFIFRVVRVQVILILTVSSVTVL